MVAVLALSLHHGILHSVDFLSRIALCLIVGRPPWRQIVAWSISQILLHTHFLDVFFSGHPYLMFKASWNSHFSFVHVKLNLDLGEVGLSGKKRVVSSLDRLVAIAARATLPISHSSQLKCIDHMTLPNMIYKFVRTQH